MRFAMTMIAHRLSHDFAPLSRCVAAFAAVVGRIAKHWTATWRHRNDMTVLASLDERALADMGLTRADVRDAIAQPLWRDPTAVLAERRRERCVNDYRVIFTQLVRERNSPPLAPGAEALRYPPTNRPARFTL
jgi:uncharacterized protein YjiS (DUF1127 family)